MGVARGAGPTSPRALRDRRHLQVVFALFLVTGVIVGAYAVWAVADWIRPEGEGAFGLFFVGAVSFVPTVLGLLFGVAYLFMASKDRDVRLGVVVTTGHLVWWLLLIGIAASSEPRAWRWVERILTAVEPGLYAIGMTVLAARWFWLRRGDRPVNAAA